MKVALKKELMPFKCSEESEQLTYDHTTDEQSLQVLPVISILLPPLHLATPCSLLLLLLLHQPVPGVPQILYLLARINRSLCEIDG